MPLVWLLAVTMTAGVQKIWTPGPAHWVSGPGGGSECRRRRRWRARWLRRRQPDEAGAIEQAGQALPTNRVLHFNNVLDAVVAGGFLVLVSAIVLLSVREWVLLLARRKPAVLHETEPVWLPEYAVAESRPLRVAGAVALALALAKELSGEAEMDRARQAAVVCECEHAEAGGAVG